MSHKTDKWLVICSAQNTEKRKKKRQILSNVIQFYVYLEKLKFVEQIEVHGISILIFTEGVRPAREYVM